MTRGGDGAMRGGGVRSEETGQLAGQTRGTKGNDRNERRRQMGGGGMRRGNVTTSRTTRGLEGRDKWPELSVDTADGSLMVRYCAMAPRRQWTVRRLPDGEGRCSGYSTVRDGNGEWMVMDNTALQRWTARRQLNGEEWRNGDLKTMDDEERRERDGNVDTSGGGGNKGQRVITL